MLKGIEGRKTQCGVTTSKRHHTFSRTTESQQMTLHKEYMPYNKINMSVSCLNCRCKPSRKVSDEQRNE